MNTVMHAPDRLLTTVPAADLQISGSWILMGHPVFVRMGTIRPLMQVILFAQLVMEHALHAKLPLQTV